MTRVFAMLVGLGVVGAGLGYLVGEKPVAPIGAAAGVELAWALHRRAVSAMLVGMLKGGLFVALVGPGIDWLISGRPVWDRMPVAAIAGSLVGGALGVRNFSNRRSAEP